MSGGWGEGRADCAQANSFRLKHLKLLRHLMTRVWHVYDTLWDVETLSLKALNLVNSALNRSSGNGMQRLEVTRQRALRPGPRNLRWKHVKKSPIWLEIGLQIGVNDLQGKNMLNCYQAIFRNYWTSTLHVRTYGLDPWLCLLRVRLSWMNDSDGTDFEALCLQSFMEFPDFVRSESHWTSKFRWILRWKITDPPRSMSRIAGLSSCPGLRSASWDDEVLRIFHGFSKSFSFKHVYNNSDHSMIIRIIAPRCSKYGKDEMR